MSWPRLSSAVRAAARASCRLRSRRVSRFGRASAIGVTSGGCSHGFFGAEVSILLGSGPADEWRTVQTADRGRIMPSSDEYARRDCECGTTERLARRARRLTGATKWAIGSKRANRPRPLH